MAHFSKKLLGATLAASFLFVSAFAGLVEDEDSPKKAATTSKKNNPKSKIKKSKENVEKAKKSISVSRKETALKKQSQDQALKERRRKQMETLKKFKPKTSVKKETKTSPELEKEINQLAEKRRKLSLSEEDDSPEMAKLNEQIKNLQNQLDQKGKKSPAKKSASAAKKTDTLVAGKTTQQDNLIEQLLLKKDSLEDMMDSLAQQRRTLSTQKGKDTELTKINEQMQKINKELLAIEFLVNEYQKK